MPFPLIPAIIGGVLVLAAVVAVPVAVKEARRALKGKRIAILGRQEVGKSTLLHYLTEGKLPDRRKRTPDPLPGGQFTLRIPGRSEARFSVPQDLPGHTIPAFKEWREAFESADYVWYLFRSDRIVSGDALEMELVGGHLAHLGDWYEELRNRNRAPKVILVGVFADLDATYSDDGAFEDQVRNAELIRQGSLRLGKADIVIGSQASKNDAAALVKRIAGYLK